MFKSFSIYCFFMLSFIFNPISSAASFDSIDYYSNAVLSAIIGNSTVAVETGHEDVPFLLVNKLDASFLSFQSNDDNTSVDKITFNNPDGTMATLEFDENGRTIVAATDEVIYLFYDYTDSTVGLSIISNEGEILVGYITLSLIDASVVAILEGTTNKSAVQRSIAYDNTYFTAALDMGSHGITFLKDAAETLENTGSFSPGQLGVNVFKQGVKTVAKSYSPEFSLFDDIVSTLGNVAGCVGVNHLACASIVYDATKNVSTLYDIYRDIKHNESYTEEMTRLNDAMQDALEARRLALAASSTSFIKPSQEKCENNGGTWAYGECTAAWYRAADICILPSKGQLEALITGCGGVLGSGPDDNVNRCLWSLGYPSDTYWSSTEAENNSAWRVSFFYLFSGMETQMSHRTIRCAGGGQ